MRNTTLALLAAFALMAPVAAPAAQKPAARPAAKAAAKYDEAKLKALEAKLAKKPADAKLKAEVAEANYQVGHTMMYNDSLPPRIKYRGALKLFRRAMELNPKHAQAAADRKQIEDIYKQMGMPIQQ
jgi:hypothetical protein